MATPPAYAKVKWPSQSFSPRRDPDPLWHDPAGCSGLASTHGPRGRRSSPSFRTPWPLVPPSYSASPLQGIWALGRHHCHGLHHSTAEGEKQQHWRWTVFTETTVWGTRHFCQLQLAQNHLNLRAEHLSCSCIPSMLLPAAGTKTWEQNMAARKKLFWNIQAHVLSWLHKINRGVRLTRPMQQQNLSPRAQDGSALNLSCQQHTLACWLPTEWLCNLKPP